MEKKKNLGFIPKLAKSLGMRSVNSACILWLHQPKVPDALKRECEKK